MKKIYMKPQMQVYPLREMSLLTGSNKGVYSIIDGVEGPKYGGYVTEEEEEEFDPD